MGHGSVQDLPDHRSFFNTVLTFHAIASLPTHDVHEQTPDINTPADRHTDAQMLHLLSHGQTKPRTHLVQSRAWWRLRLN